MEHTFALQVARCLSHMHARGYVHGDVKPLNIMRMGHGFKLIDLDASVSFAAGDFACAKFSSGFVPPECIFVDGDSDSGAACVRSPLCRVMVAADGALHYMEDAGRGDAGSDDGNGHEGEEEDVKVTTLDFALVPSHPAQDMWAYGVVLYHMAAKCALFNCDFAGTPHCNPPPPAARPRTSAATCPTSCLSAPLITIRVGFSALISIPAGITYLISWL
jgi:serine/threonine protein kinase